MKLRRIVAAAAAIALLGGSALISVSAADAATLPYVNAANPDGWGDLKNGTFTDDGVQLNATETEEAYVYKDFVAGFLLSESDSLATDASNVTGTFGVILQTAGGDSIHYEYGAFWTTVPGIFPETSPGRYGANDLSNLQSDPNIVEVAVWVNPGGSLLLHSQSFGGNTQPFGIPAAAVVDPPSAATPAVPIAGNVSFTG